MKETGSNNNINFAEGEHKKYIQSELKSSRL